MPECRDWTRTIFLRGADEDYTMSTKGRMLERLRVILAGRAAEEVAIQCLLWYFCSSSRQSWFDGAHLFCAACCQAAQHWALLCSLQAICRACKLMHAVSVAGAHVKDRKLRKGRGD